MKYPSFIEAKLNIIYERLKHYKWNRTQAAKSLEISVRSVRNYVVMLREFGVRIPDCIPPKGGRPKKEEPTYVFDED